MEHSGKKNAKFDRPEQCAGCMFVEIFQRTNDVPEILYILCEINCFNETKDHMFHRNNLVQHYVPNIGCLWLNGMFHQNVLVEQYMPFSAKYMFHRMFRWKSRLCLRP